MHTCFICRHGHIRVLQLRKIMERRMAVLANLMVVVIAVVGVTSLPPLPLPSSPTLAQDYEVSPSQLLKVHRPSLRLKCYQ